MSKKVVLTTLFIQEKSVTQRDDMLHTIDGPVQLIHADVADLHRPFCVDLITSKTYTYGMNKNHLSTKLEKFYSDTESLKEYLKGENRNKMQ